jgi:hypothetical protein
MKNIDELTPKSLGKDLMALIDYTVGDRFYEPFRGNGTFYDVMPEPKDWAEIKMGRDFFTYLPFNGHCEHIITNPPFRVDGKNAFIPTLERSFGIATKTVAMLINHKLMNTFTPVRLERYKQMGWVITKIHVVSIEKWFGRYWFVVFKKGGNSIISWSLKNYGDGK